MTAYGKEAVTGFLLGLLNLFHVIDRTTPQRNVTNPHNFELRIVKGTEKYKK